MQTLELPDYSPAGDAKTGTFVFLFGAGCSADGGSPVMREFMIRAREHALDPESHFKDDYDRLRQFHGRCLKICYAFDRWWENIEDLYTQAHLRALAGFPDADDVCASISRTIWDVYRRSFQGEGYRALLSSLAKLRDRWSASARPRPVILTTNYDVQLEAVLTNPKASYGFQAFYCGPFGKALAGRLYSNDVQQITRQQLIEVVKLHGSVNWFESPRDSGSFECDARTVHDDPGYDPASSTSFFFQQDNEVIQQVSRGEVRPLIVPPTLGKLAQGKVVANNWNRAIYNLRNARVLVVAGYSFPETDSFMTRLLAEGIKDADSLRRIVIINNCADTRWYNRVRRIFSRSWTRYNISWVRGDFASAMAAIDNPGLNPTSGPFDDESGSALYFLSQSIWGK